MYEDYYRFTRPPFSLTPDPEFLFKSPSHQAALEQLVRGIKRGEGFFLLTGDVGTGKTTVCRSLVDQLGRNVFTALVINPFLTLDELLRAMLLDFGVVDRDEARTGAFAWATRQQLLDTLNGFLISLARIGATAVVVIDEAQHLSPSLLEGVRLLSNLETDDRKLLQILLVGQPELVTALEHDEMRQLRQRIARRVALRPLTRSELDHYVAFRLRLASGGGGGLFAERALDLVYEFSGGVPRTINLICDRALEAGFTALSTAVTDEIVVRAAELLELHHDPTAPPSHPRPAALPTWEPVRARRLRPSTRAVAATVGVAAGIAIGVGGGRYVGQWLETNPIVPPRAPLSQAAAPVPPPVDLGPAAVGSGAPTAFVVHAAVFPDAAGADQTAAMLREFGYRAAVGETAADGVPVVIGPFTSLDGARRVEEELRARLRFRDAQTVAIGE